MSLDDSESESRGSAFFELVPLLEVPFLTAVSASTSGDPDSESSSFDVLMISASTSTNGSTMSPNAKVISLSATSLMRSAIP